VLGARTLLKVAMRCNAESGKDLPAENEFGSFSAPQNTSGGRKDNFNIFTQN